MDMNTLEQFFLWCTVINFIIFLLSFIMITLMKNFIIRMHGKWYKIPEEKFDLIFYNFMLYYKIAILFFNLVPYIAVRIIS